MRTVPSIIRTGGLAGLLGGLTAVMATGALGNPGHGPGGTGAPGQVTKNPPVTTAPAPVPPAPATPPGQKKDPAATPPGQAKKAPAATTPAPDSTATGQPTADPAATVPAAVRPVLGRSMAVTPAAGTVKVKLPDGTGYVPLADAGSIPSGTTVDARQGTVTLRTAIAGGGTQTATFWGAVFEIRQGRDGSGMTDLVLKDGVPAGCRGARRASARAARVPSPRAKTRSSGLWAKDRNGRFRSRGRNSVATVRGTRWLTRETCAGTLTRVAEGAVAVGDLRRHRTVLVRAGHSYLARDAR
jgi:hypothetical protein